MCEDDPNDAMLIQRAFRKQNITNPVQLVENGDDAIAYLSGNGKYVDRLKYPLPKVILLDLKMPRKTGLEVLQWLKDHPEYQVIPTCVLTSSKEGKDIALAYKLGANCFLVKPCDFDGMQEMVRKLHDFWSICEKPL